MTYLCNYCGTLHELDTRSVEHVVPEKLFNNSLVLRDACRFWNNFFARSFETQVTSSAFMREVLLEFTPASERPRGAVHLGTVETARGTTEHRWLLKGEERLRDVPARQTTDLIMVDAFDGAGAAYPLEVQLPFSITTGVSGDDHAVAEIRRRLEKERERVRDYVTKLAREPETDEALRVLLEEQGLRLREPKAVAVEERTISSTPGGPVSDILPRAHVLDLALWTKFYVKIAWCFACLKLGRSTLIGIGGDLLLDYLQSGLLPAECVAAVRAVAAPIAEALFSDMIIEGKTVSCWKASIHDAKALVAGLHGPALYLLTPFVEARAESERIASTRIKFITPGALDRVAGGPGEAQRRHTLRLRRELASDRAALVCDIQLFGGVFEVVVQLTPQLPITDLDNLAEVVQIISF